MGSFYAQLTRNGHSDDDGPDVWITPGSSWPAIHHADVLAELIAEATGAPLQDVRAAMDADPDAGVELPAWRPPRHDGPERMTVHGFGDNLPGVWGYDPARAPSTHASAAQPASATSGPATTRSAHR